MGCEVCVLWDGDGRGEDGVGGWRCGLGGGGGGGVCVLIYLGRGVRDDG